MKKAVYFSIMLLTVYLNLVYEWEEGTSVLSVEILFLLFLYGTVRLWKGKIAVLPVGGFQIAEEGEHLDIPFIVENRGRRRVSPLLNLRMRVLSCSLRILRKVRFRVQDVQYFFALRKCMDFIFLRKILTDKNF